MQELKQKTSDFNLYQYLIESNKNDFLKHVSYRYIKKNYLQSLKEDSDYIFEMLEGAVKVGFYSGSRNEVISEILVSGDFYGNYLIRNKTHIDLVKPLTHVKVRVYNVRYIKNLILLDSDVAKFFHQVNQSILNYNHSIEKVNI